MRKNYFDGRTMHIDISKRFYQRGDSGMAFKIVPSQKHKGVVISKRLKKLLKKKFDLNKNYTQLYAICIYYLIYDELDNFDNLVICNDESYSDVKKYLDMLFEGNAKYSSKFITSLSQLRKISGDFKVRSSADNMANIYRRKSLKSLKRRQKGIALNLVEINYQKIKEKWRFK
jgi:hypothetical protein